MHLFTYSLILITYSSFVSSLLQPDRLNVMPLISKHSQGQKLQLDGCMPKNEAIFISEEKLLKEISQKRQTSLHCDNSDPVEFSLNIGKKCNGLKKCSINIENKTFMNMSCQPELIYLHLTYTCMPDGEINENYFNYGICSNNGSILFNPPPNGHIFTIDNIFKMKYDFFNNKNQHACFMKIMVNSISERLEVYLIHKRLIRNRDNRTRFPIDTLEINDRNVLDDDHYKYQYKRRSIKLIYNSTKPAVFKYNLYPHPQLNQYSGFSTYFKVIRLTEIEKNNNNLPMSKIGLCAGGFRAQVQCENPMDRWVIREFRYSNDHKDHCGNRVRHTQDCHVSYDTSIIPNSTLYNRRIAQYYNNISKIIYPKNHSFVKIYNSDTKSYFYRNIDNISNCSFKIELLIVTYNCIPFVNGTQEPENIAQESNSNIAIVVYILFTILGVVIVASFVVLAVRKYFKQHFKPQSHNDLGYLLERLDSEDY